MPDKSLQVGITGGIGSGKSTICKIFKTLGIPVYESDSRAKWLMNHMTALKAEIQKQFGEQSYTAEGELNRAYLANQVFNDNQKISLLNSLVHPFVGKDYLEWVSIHPHTPYTLNEAALMFESGRYKSLDKVITVFAPEDMRIARVLNRDPQRSEAEVKAIIQKQLSEDEKIKQADFVIYNDEKQLVIPQVILIHEKLLKETQKD
jgi:dephospho-CoA kinase